MHGRLMNNKHKMDNIDVMAMTLILIAVFILSPILSYSLYRFHKIRTAAIMKFRNLTLVYLINILVLFSIIFVGPFGCATEIWHVINKPFSNINIGPFIIWYIYLLFAIKTWLLYFEQKYHVSLINLTWKKLINEYAKSWHINTRHKYGNYKYLLKIGLIPYCFYISLQILINTSIHTPILSSGLNWVLTAFPLLFSCVLFYKFHTRGFKDIYKISNEIRYQCIVIVLVLICNTAIISVCLLYQSVTHTDIHRIQHLSQLIITYILLFGVAILSTAYPVYIYHKQLQIDSLNRYQNKNKCKVKQLSGFKQMIGVLKNINGFKQFMLHLLQEFSTENLVFLVELIQIKHAFQQRNNNLILVPKQPIYATQLQQSSEINHKRGSNLPGFDAITNSNSSSASSKNSPIPDMTEVDFTNMKNTSETTDRKQSMTVTLTISPASTPQHSNTNSADNDAIYQDNEAYMVLDFNAIELFENCTAMTALNTSPSPPPPPMDMTDELPPLPTVLANRCTSTRSMTHERNIGKMHQKNAQSMPKLPPNSTFLGRARSKSRNFMHKRREESVYTYLFRESGDLFLRLDIPNGLPQSAALSNANSLPSEMEYLYHKFVAIDSMHEINLSHSIRAPLIQVFETEKLHLSQKQESFLFNIFDSAAHSILELMLDSYHRFVLSEKFQNLSMDFTEMTTSTPQTHTPQTNTPQTTTNTPVDTTENEIILELPIFRNASSYHKLLMQYQISK